jgi:hypothetical protein
MKARAYGSRHIVYLIRGVGFETVEMPLQVGLVLPAEYYILVHSRTQIHPPRPNIFVPKLLPQFMEFSDVARLRNRMLTGVFKFI